jgi:hypothetical protein
MQAMVAPQQISACNQFHQLAHKCNLENFSSKGTIMQVWYEWALASPQPSIIHNAKGHAASMSLDTDDITSVEV